MEPENELLEEEIPIKKPIIFRFHVNFRGCNWGLRSSPQQQNLRVAQLDPPDPRSSPASFLLNLGAPVVWDS